MRLITERTIPKAWVSAASQLATLDGRRDFDVFVNVKEPLLLRNTDFEVVGRLDDFLVRGGGYSLNTVAETIFPLDDYLHGGARAVFEDYPAKMKAIHAVRDRGWGCYAMRLIEHRRDGEGFSPLRDLVERIKARRSGSRASFELGLDWPFEADLAIYDPERDRKKHRGLPCLSHISMKIDGTRLRMNATYRSHFYVQRLVGNLVGLGWLMVFIATEAGLEVGELTVNSTLAFLDAGSDNGSGRSWSPSSVRQLLGECQAIYDRSSDSL